MQFLLLSALYVMFTIRALDPTYIYLDTSSTFNEMQVIRLEFVNDGETRNLVFMLNRISTPPDLSFSQCVGNLCHFQDSISYTYAGGIMDTIELEFYSGQTPGLIDAFYLVYDAGSPWQRDSIHITGVVPVREQGNTHLEYFNGILRGEDIRRVTLYSISGAVVYEGSFNSVSEVELPVTKNGVFLCRVLAKGKIMNFKIVRFLR